MAYPTALSRGTLIKITAAALGLFLFALYLFTYRGGFHSVDEVSTFAVTESLVKFGQFNTDQIAWTQWVTTQAEAQGFFGQDNHIYSKKGLAISLAQAPLYWLALMLPGIGMLQTVSLLNAILTAWSGVLIYLILRRLDFSGLTALVVALFYGCATLAWVYARYLFSGTLAGFLLILTLYLLLVYKQQGGLWRVALAGLCGGLTVLARANNLLLLALFGLYLLVIVFAPRKDRSRPRSFSRIIGALLAFVGGAALIGGLFAWYNWIRSGDPLQTGYDLSIFSPNILLGLYKLLFSPLRGLFVYSPILLLTIPGWLKFRKRYPLEAWLIFGLCGVTILLFSAWASGEGLSWGSRFMVPIVPLLALTLAPLIADFTAFPRLIRGGIVALTIISIFIQIIGVVINPWVFLGQLQGQFGGEFFLERTAALTDFSTSQIVGQLQNWRVDYSDLVWWQPASFDSTAFGLGLLLLLVSGWLLTRVAAAEQSGQTTLPLGRITIGLVLPLTLGITFVLLIRYYRTDQQQFGPLNAPYLQALNQVADSYDSDDRVFTVAQYDYHVPMNRFKARVPLLGFAQNDDVLPASALPLLQEAIARNRADTRIWLVTVGRQPAEPTNRVERWLADNAYKASNQWLGETRLLDYGVPQPGVVTTIDQLLGEVIRLIEFERPQQLAAGGILPIQFVWEATTLPTVDYKVFVQLIAIDGTVAAQIDGVPQGGYLPTTSWPPNERITDRHGLALPATLAPGNYRLIAGLYDPNDGSRLATTTGSDFIDLGIVTVEP